MILKKLKTRLKLRRRSHKKKQKLESADIVILRYPKSGVTWLRVMISRIYQQRHDLPASSIVGRSDMAALQGKLPHIFIAMDNIDASREALEEAMRGKKLLLLIRDPRDIVVSLFFHFSKRATRMERLVFGIPKDVEERGLFDFVMNPDYGLLRIIDFTNYWFRLLDRSGAGAIVRYEDLRKNPEATLAKVMTFLGADATDDEIRDAVEFASMDKMKDMERQNSFGLKILKATDNADPDSFKVRRGKVKGYLDYFNPEEVKAIDDLLRGSLDPATGYA